MRVRVEGGDVDKDIGDEKDVSDDEDFGSDEALYQNSVDSWQLIERRNST